MGERGRGCGCAAGLVQEKTEEETWVRAEVGEGLGRGPGSGPVRENDGENSLVRVGCPIRGSANQIKWRIGAIVIALGIGSASCSGPCPESYPAGAALPYGSRTLGLSGGRAVLFAAYGSEKTTRGDEGVPLFHVLILEPDRASRICTNSFESQCVRATATFEWAQEENSPILKLEYDGARKELVVGEKAWSTATANTFVIRLDDQWRPTVRPLPLLLKDASHESTLRRIQEALPADEGVGSLRVEAPSFTVP